MSPITDHSTDTAQIRLGAFRWTIVGAPVLILFAAYLLTSGRIIATPQAAKPTKSVAAADDWRRTANGWERTQSWPVAASRPWQLFAARHLPPTASPTAARVATRSSRLEMHPATLALAQLSVSILALAFFGRTHQNPLHFSSLFTAIARSFRASAFG